MLSRLLSTDYMVLKEGFDISVLHLSAGESACSALSAVVQKEKKSDSLKN